MKRTNLIALLLAGGLLLGGTGYWALGSVHAEPQKTTQAAKPASRSAVETAMVRVGTVTISIDAIGTLQSGEAVVLAPEVAGIISEILFEEGTNVKAGDPLVKLDDAILKAELDQARAQLTLTQANFERANTLLRQNSGTQRARDEALAALQSARASATLAQTRLDKMVIRAPFSGVLGLRSVSKGEYVTPGKALISLQTIDPLKAEFRVPETFLSSIKVGQTIDLTADALPGRTFTGRITAIAPQIDVNGRALQIRAYVPNQEQILRSGLFVRVDIAAASRDNALLVPESAIVPEGEVRTVFVVENGKVKRTPVKLGQRRVGEVEVLEGLSAGQEVVTAGQQRLRDGAAVEIVNARAGS